MKYLKHTLVMVIAMTLTPAFASAQDWAKARVDKS